MKRLTIGDFRFVIAAAAALGLAGCSGEKKQETTGQVSGGGPTKIGAATGDKKFVIGMSQCTESEPWRVQMDKDIKDAAAAHPEIELQLNNAMDKSETQQSQVRELIQKKVDLIIISPKESRPLTRPVEEAMDAGIPVIVLDRKIEGDKYTCFIGGDNVKIGREAGKYTAKLLGGKGNIIELQGLNTSTPEKERHDGFMDGIKGSQIKILAGVDCKWKGPEAQKEMSSLLGRFPQIDAVYAHNDPSAFGARLAALHEGKGREKTIKFIGIDSLPTEGVRYVKEGLLTATFQYPTGGKEAIETALKILKKETIEKNVILGTRVFTKENADKGGDAL